ncbi:hypothetical protein EDB89DRAFT_1482651 [Lactarius sanguifluus]|nr:hypothetical protein EDB89DRAFT_1482651 [Lactarius sanguifluus]
MWSLLAKTAFFPTLCLGRCISAQLYSLFSTPAGPNETVSTICPLRIMLLGAVYHLRHILALRSTVRLKVYGLTLRDFVAREPSTNPNFSPLLQSCSQEHCRVSARSRLFFSSSLRVTS